MLSRKEWTKELGKGRIIMIKWIILIILKGIKVLNIITKLGLSRIKCWHLYSQMRLYWLKSAQAMTLL